MNRIRTHLSLALAHLSPTSREWLSKAALANTHYIAKTPVGFFVYAEEFPDDFDYPTDLCKAMKRARELGHEYLLFDEDGEIWSDLDYYDDTGRVVRPGRVETADSPAKHQREFVDEQARLLEKLRLDAENGPVNGRFAYKIDVLVTIEEGRVVAVNVMDGDPIKNPVLVTGAPADLERMVQVAQSSRDWPSWELGS